jgi:hypothetical protein
MSESDEFGWLVSATYKGKRTFPLCTVVGAETAMDAIEYALTMGWCFSRGCWVVKAVLVALVPKVAAARS